MDERAVGRVVGLWRYPVKSMAAEALREVEVGWHGFAGDRRWAFVRGDVPRSGFPWLTIRERRDLLEHVPRFVDEALPDSSRVVVRTPSGEEVDVLDLSLGEGVRPIKQDRGVFDAAPLSLITTQAVAGVRADLDPQRFRPNLLVEALDGGPAPENEWIGAQLRIGSLVMRADLRDQRCVIVNVDPSTGARDASVLKTIARERASCLGIYGSVVRPGRVAMGDTVMCNSAPGRLG